MDISCAFPPVPGTPEHIALAERLGYRRAWVYDTPALQLDVSYPNDIDRKVLTGGIIRRYTFTGEAAALRQRMAELGSRGVTEIAYQPAGPDIPRELTAFARMAGLAGAAR